MKTILTEVELMPIPIPKGKNITVERKTFPPSYDMPSHSMATDHYSIIYVISGERRAVSFEESFTYHSGNAVLTPPFKYNRTLSDGNVVYERYLINQFRKEFGMKGTPVRIIVREKVEKEEKIWH